MTEQELSELDLAVAKAEGFTLIKEQGVAAPWVGITGAGDMRQFSPTRDPAEAMRLLVKYKLTVSPSGRMSADYAWFAYPGGPTDRDAELDSDGTDKGYGSTPAIAICRAVVALRAASCQDK